MQIGIIGLPQAGRRTIFRLLTGNPPREGEGVKRGEGRVHDPRLAQLSKMYPEAKKVPAVIEFLLLPPLSNNSEQNQALFKTLEEADALCYVIRVFENETVFHIDGSIEPLRDIQKIDAELILKDLSFVELRLERLEKAFKKGKNKLQEKERELLLDFKARLEEGHFLFDLKLNEEQQRIISGYPLLTLKKKIVVLNVNEDKLNDSNLIDPIRELYKSELFSNGVKKIESSENVQVVQISAKIEQELFQLESEQEQKEFLKALNIEEPAIYKMGRASYQILGLISFFTIGNDEVRAWSIHRGTLAPQAAGKVHSDIERGFIRAQVIKYNDLIRLGSEQAVAQAGLSLLKGKDYLVEDGDIIDFRFNV